MVKKSNGLYVKYPLFLSALHWTWTFSTGFKKKIYSNINCHENPSCESWVLPHGETDGRTDMTKLIVFFFRNFANAFKQW